MHSLTPPQAIINCLGDERNEEKFNEENMKYMKSERSHLPPKKLASKVGKRSSLERLCEDISKLIYTSNIAQFN